MMKKLVILCISLLTASFVWAQSSNTGSPTEQSNPNAPEITFEKVIYDYGEIKQGDNGLCEFKFTNTGKEPLILSRPRSNCGCTIPTWPRQPILPGKGGVIKVMYDTKRLGIINKTITIFSNAKNRVVVLRIKGKIQKKSN